MANVFKKHSISFSRMDWAPIPTIEMAQNKSHTALLGVSTQDFFNFIQGDQSLLARTLETSVQLPSLSQTQPCPDGLQHL